jgi:phosphomannomutase
MKKYCKSTKKLKIVVDAGNGMAGLEIPEFAKHYPNLDIVPLYFNLDGTFPNHDANPSDRSTLQDLKKKVIEEGADFGCAFDGDADRVGGFVDEQGNLLANDLITALLAKDRIEKNGGKGKILYVVPSSHIIADIVSEAGGTPIMSRVGRAFVVDEMVKQDAIFGGEFTGHYCFPEFGNFDCALLAFINVLNILEYHNGTFSELFSNMHRYVASGEINVEVSDKDAVLKLIKETYNDGELNELDGISISYDTFWFNVRPSNTEPLLRINLEAKDQAVLDKEKEKLVGLVEKH